MPENLGAMGNDRLGDCPCAAYYHARQVWTWNATGHMDAQPDADVIALYEQACGYNPADPSTDRGGVEQSVLSYLVNSGAPTTAGRDKLAAFVEVDPRQQNDVRAAIFYGGVAYIGFNVPAFLSNFEAPGSVWDVQPGADRSIVGGHAVVLAGYDAEAAWVISWGNRYRMTWAFFAQYVDEAYMLADSTWIRATGMDPLGFTLAQLEAQMQWIKGN